jgi:hypothetical protein
MALHDATAPPETTAVPRGREPGCEAARRWQLRSTQFALAAGLALLALAIGLVLSGSHPVVASTNSVPVEKTLGYAGAGSSGCQTGGTLPAGTTAVRLSLGANIGPSVALHVFSGSQLVASGTRAAGWGIAESVTVPVRRVPRTVSGVRLCIRLGPETEPVSVLGGVTREPVSPSKTRVVRRSRIEYLRPSRLSWWALLPWVAERMGLGHAASGTWVVFLELALMLAVAALASYLVLRAVGRTPPRLSTGPAPNENPSPAGGNSGKQARRRRVSGAHERLAAGRGVARIAWAKFLVACRRAPRATWALLVEARRGIPRAAWICALIAFLNAACWSLISPPFQVPDEPSHFAYVQQIAENGSLPTGSNSEWSEEQSVVMRALHHLEVRFFPEHIPISSQAEQQRLEEDLSRPLSRSGEGGAGVAASEPPLYYALETIPYALASGGTILDRLELMRLLSALMGGLTALFGYLFVREALPRARWAWAVGGLGIALAPLLAFESGGVTPDALWFAVAAAIFYCLARAFRRGLTWKLAVGIGALLATASFTKLNFIGIVPGIVIGLLVLTLRDVRRTRPGLFAEALRGPRASRGAALGAGARAFAVAAAPAAVALAIGAAPAVLYILVNLARGHSTLGAASQGLHLTGGEFSYIWQFYLPKLPGMATKFPGISPLHVLWFDRSVGLYGWLDTQFANWVYDIALIPAALLAALAIRALFVARSSLRRRLGELATYALMGVGLLALTGAASYTNYPTQAGRFSEPRYLLPLIALFGAWLALSARGGGRRLGAAVGALIVVLVLGWDVFSQLQMIARYYG